MIGSAENKVQMAEEAMATAGMPQSMQNMMSAMETTSPLMNPILLGGFSNYRYQQTMIKGGFKDSKFMSTIRPGSRRAGLRSFAAGSLTPTDLNASSFFGGRNIFGQETRRGRKFLNRANRTPYRTTVATPGMYTPTLAPGVFGPPAPARSVTRNIHTMVTPEARATYGMGRGFRTNYNPINMLRGRYSNLSVFGAGHNRNFYAPNQGGILSSIGNMGSKDNPRFSGGVIGRLGAISKMERVANKGGIRAGRRLAKYDMNIARVMGMNNAGLVDDVMKSSVQLARGTGPVGMSGLTAQQRLAAARAAQTQGQLGTARALAASGGATIGKGPVSDVTVGMRRYGNYEGVRGRYSRTMMRGILTSGGGVEMRTLGGSVTRSAAFGVTNIAMTDTAEKIIRPLATALENNDKLLNRAISRGISGGNFAPSMADDIVKARLGTMATQIVDDGIIKSLGVRGAAQAVKSGGTRVGLAVAGEVALKALPGVNLIFAADMAYQLAKLAGLGVKAGINFAKDGVKSMQGTMNNGVFGNGYQDNEVAATSRSRGVMAIQNSRLNARSLLGSEASMMHAHFG